MKRIKTFSALLASFMCVPLWMVTPAISGWPYASEDPELLVLGALCYMGGWIVGLGTIGMLTNKDELRS